MDIEQRTERLQSMMRPYKGSQHTVVAFGIQHGETSFISSGPQNSEVSCDELIFEIGSITKVFTAILLCLLVEEGKVDPHAPLSEMSDDLANVPNWITPENLASHTSGLPRIHAPLWRALINPLPEDPYAGFSRSDLLAWFQNWSRTAPGHKSRHAYSNLGVGLLGEAMALKAGKPFMELLAEKVIAPLGLKDTTDSLDVNQRERFLQPMTTNGKAVPAWTFQSMAAAGCLRSTASDLARFSCRVIQAVNAPETALDRAISRSAMPILGLGSRGRSEQTAQCAGWMLKRFGRSGPRLLYHDGATAGSTCAIYICPDQTAACGVVSNNGVAANLWGDIKLSLSNQRRQAHDLFRAI